MTIRARVFVVISALLIIAGLLPIGWMTMMSVWFLGPGFWGSWLLVVACISLLVFALWAIVAVVRRRVSHGLVIATALADALLLALAGLSVWTMSAA